MEAARLRAQVLSNSIPTSSRPVCARAIRSALFSDGEEEIMLEAIKQALGLDEEGKKRRQQARDRVREEERRERAERVRQDAEALKKTIGK